MGGPAQRVRVGQAAAEVGRLAVVGGAKPKCQWFGRTQ